MTDNHPLRFAYLPNDYGYFGCYDRIDFPIMFIGNYALFRPNYTRNKHGDCYRYDDLVIVDLSKSYIDMNKLNILLQENNIDLTQQTHIVNRCFSNTAYDDTWYNLLKQSSPCVSITVQDTSMYYLSRIQYISANNQLLITHEKYREPRTYTLIDMNTLLVVESGFGNCRCEKLMQNMPEITFDIAFDYFYESGFDELTPINTDSGDDKLNYSEYHCKYRILVDKLGEPKYRSYSILSPPQVGANLVETQRLETQCQAHCLRYTFKSIGVIKSNGLLFMETNAFTTEWYIDNMYRPAVRLLETTCVPHDIYCIVGDHILFEIFKYVTQIYKVMRLICVTSIAYKEHERRFEWVIPTTWDKFHEQTKRILG